MVEILNNIIKKKAYNYHGVFYGPHDMKVTEYANGKTRRQSAKDEGYEFEILPKTSISDGIDAVRDIFSRCRFDTEKTEEGRAMLAKYKKQWNETIAEYIDRPAKGRANHAADGFRYMAQAIGGMDAETKADKEAEGVHTPNRGI